MVKVSLHDCLQEINHALNCWYPTRETADEEEITARHVRLFSFRDRLNLELKNEKAGNEKLVRCLENALALVEHYGLRQARPVGEFRCPSCVAVFKDDECSTRREVIGGTLYHEAPILIECPACLHEFEDVRGVLFPHLWGGTLDGNLAAWRKAIAEAKQ